MHLRDKRMTGPRKRAAPFFFAPTRAFVTGSGDAVPAMAIAGVSVSGNMRIGVAGLLLIK
ncbi:MAG: hypothetical protein QOI24_2708 [Acidobacteriota bacterium]|jgi:hypothetical protein|nr:hypothetical protein [Acidobacteriota bacterium]